MEETIYSSSYVECTYQSDDRLVLVEWRKEMEPDEYRKLFTALLNFWNQRPVHLMLSDIRREGLVKIEDARWLNDQIQKVIRQEKLQRLALVTEDTIFASAYSGMLQNKFQGSTTQVAVFHQVEAARTWLLNG